MSGLSDVHALVQCYNEGVEAAERVTVVGILWVRQAAADQSRIAGLGHLINGWREQGADEFCDQLEQFLAMHP